MDVIICVPVYRSASYLETLFSGLYKLEPQPSKVIFVENNSTDNTLIKVARYKRPHEVIRFWLRDDWIKHSDTVYDAVAIARQFGLQRSRELKPDYLLFFDSDMIINQKDLLDELTRWPTDIVGGAYLRLFHVDAVPEYSQPEGASVMLAASWKHPQIPNMLQRRSRALKIPFDDTVLTVGGGCLLLNNKVFNDERINFYPIQIENHSEDFGYVEAARRFGYTVGLDSAARISHLITPSKNWFKPWNVGGKLVMGKEKPHFTD